MAVMLGWEPEDMVHGWPLTFCLVTLDSGRPLHGERRRRRREEGPGLGEKIVRPDLEVEFEMSLEMYGSKIYR